MSIETLKLEAVDPRKANTEILVRFYPDSNNRSNHRLISLNTLRGEIGDAFTAKFVNKFWPSGKRKEVFRLRRGIEVVFYNR